MCNGRAVPEQPKIEKIYTCKLCSGDGVVCVKKSPTIPEDCVEMREYSCWVETE